MGIYSLKPAFQLRLLGVADALSRRKISPDTLTFLGIVASLAGAVALAAGAFLLVPVAASIRTAFNALDGMVASATGTSRPFGAFLNEMSDRISDLIWFIGLALVVKPELALVTAAVVLLSSSAGMASAAAGGRRIYEGVMGKADRMFVISVGSVIAAFASSRALVIATYIIAVGAVITLVQRILIARNAS